MYELFHAVSINSCNIFFSDHIIWEVYHENSEKNLFIIGFISCSLLLVIYLQDPCEVTGEQGLKEIRMISRLAGEWRKENI